MSQIKYLHILNILLRLPQFHFLRKDQLVILIILSKGVSGLL